MIKSKNIIYESKEKLARDLSEIQLRKPNRALAQVFCGVMNRDLIEEIIDLFNEYLPGTPLIGVTTDGEIYGGVSHDYSIVINISSFQKTSVESILVEKEGSIEEVGQKIVEAFDTNESKAIILFGAEKGSANKSEEKVLMDYLQKGLSTPILAGGQAMSSCKSDKAFVFTEKGITDSGFVAAHLVSGTLGVLNTYNMNWSPIGRKMKITDADGTCLKAIDGQSPYEMYKYHLGSSIVSPSSGLSKDFPLMVNREGIFHANHVKYMNDDGSFEYEDALEVGDIVQFGYCHAVLFSDSGDNICYALAGEGMEVAFVYGSVSRKKLLGSIIDKELEPLKSLHCSVGFFGEGVYYHDKSRDNIFLTEALSILALTEGFSFEQGLKPAGSCGSDVSRSSMIMRALHRLLETSFNNL